MTTYEIELTSETRPPDNIPLSAHTDTGAIREMRRWMRSHPAEITDSHVFLGFDRSDDGQHGYINPDGASPVGTPWHYGPEEPIRSAAALLGARGGSAGRGKSKRRSTTLTPATARKLAKGRDPASQVRGSSTYYRELARKSAEKRAKT